MTIIDPSTDLGKLRLRCGDWQDLPWLPDAVYVQTLEDNSGNLPRTAKTCAVYILGMLSFRTHKKLAQIESWSSEAYQNYKDFLLLTVANPNFMDVSPVPYSTSVDSPITQFMKDWNQNYYGGTESQSLAAGALRSPNDGSVYGRFIQ